MTIATRLLATAFALVLVAGSASAQNDVTFQVDMTPFIDSCQFDDSGTPPQDSVFVRGSFNEFSKANPLTDADGDGTYTGTASIAEGAIDYKFYTTNESVLGWENDVNDGGPNGNRDYTVTAGAQTIGVATFNKAVANRCGGTEKDYEVTFVVDMTTQIARGDFDASTEVVAVAGSFTGWETNAFALSPESDNPNIYTGTLEQTFEVPTTEEFKFVIRTPDGTGGFTTSYESPSSAVSPLSNGNRALTLTGDEPVDGSSGVLFTEYDNDDDASTFVTYSDASSDAILSDAATVTFVVDMRPAFYAFADSSRLPGGITDAELLDDVYVNGPIFGESDGIMTDWASWSAEGLAGRELTFNAADTTASITLSYSVGAYKALTGKFSVGGADNEAGFGGDKVVRITEGTQTVNLIFGAQVGADGQINDGNDSFDAYDPYIQVDNTATPPTATVVRRGGTDFAVANEGGPGMAGALRLSDVYPNPTAGLAHVSVATEAGEAVTIRVYDVTGREVVSVATGALVAGARTFTIETGDLASGVYVVRAESGGDVATRRLTVVR